MAAVKSSIQALKRRVSTNASTVFYNVRTEVYPSTVGGNAANYINLTTFSNWNRVFGTDADDESGKSCRIKQLKIDYHCRAFQEKDNVTLRMVCFRLKEEASADITTSGAFVASTWPVQGVDMAYEPATVISERPGIAGAT